MTKGAARMTDEKVWKALGYTHHKGGRGGMAYWKRNGSIYTPPPFYTSDLSPIVAEIEARGLDYAVGNFERGKPAYKATVGSFKTRIAKECYDDTAPLALCAALLNYIRDNKA